MLVLNGFESSNNDLVVCHNKQLDCYCTIIFHNMDKGHNVNDLSFFKIKMKP